jgi:hypothetical protein
MISFAQRGFLRIVQKLMNEIESIKYYQVLVELFRIKQKWSGIIVPSSSRDIHTYTSMFLEWALPNNNVLD